MKIKVRSLCESMISGAINVLYSGTQGKRREGEGGDGQKGWAGEGRGDGGDNEYHKGEGGEAWSHFIFLLAKGERVR